MDNLIEKIKEAAEFLRAKGFIGADTGIVLGTGLGSFVTELNVEQSVSYTEIPHFPLSTVEFHKGELLMGRIAEHQVIAMRGRFHFYEGYSMQQITFPIRVLKELGVKYLFLSNAAGGMNNDYKKGDLILIDDHINLLPDNPLRGLNSSVFGNRFVDMCAPYSTMLNEVLVQTAAAQQVDLKKGVYAAVMGPNLETRAEYRYLKSIGADMVGMSTVPEVITANHIGMQCSAVSVITDECDPDNLQPVNISEIIAIAGKADAVLSNLLKEAIAQLPIL